MHTTGNDAPVACSSEIAASVAVRAAWLGCPSSAKTYAASDAASDDDAPAAGARR